MNERIRQLLLQVVPMAGEDGEYLPSLHTPEDIEKFAEMIIKECDKYVAERYDVCEPWMEPGDLLRHFGVKE